MILTTQVACVDPYGHRVSGEALELTVDTEAVTGTLTIGRHDRAVHVPLSIIMRELRRIESARDAAKQVQP